MLRKKSEQEKWVCWFWSDIKIPRNDTSLLPEECQGWHWRGPRGYILYFSGQFIGQMRRDMINLIISGQPPAIVPSSNIPDKISPFSVQRAQAFIWWEPIGWSESWPQWHSVSVQPFLARNPPFCRLCNIPHISPAVHYFPRGSNTRGNKFGPDFSEEEPQQKRRRESPPMEAAAASRVTLLSIIIL